MNREPRVPQPPRLSSSGWRPTSRSSACSCWSGRGTTGARGLSRSMTGSAPIINTTGVRRAVCRGVVGRCAGASMARPQTAIRTVAGSPGGRCQGRRLSSWQRIRLTRGGRWRGGISRGDRCDNATPHAAAAALYALWRGRGPPARVRPFVLSHLY